MAPERKYTLRLNMLNCYMVEEHDFDDVYLKIDGRKIWPKNRKNQPMHADSTSTLDVEIPGIQFGSKVEIELWDWDLISRNDLLGTFTMLVEEVGGPFPLIWSENTRETKTAKYTLHWEVF